MEPLKTEIENEKNKIKRKDYVLSPKHPTVK